MLRPTRSHPSRKPPENDAPRYVLWASIGTFVLLLVVAALMVSVPVLSRWTHRQHLGLLPIGIVWFGAVGGSLASLTGIYLHHKTDWKSSYDLWHMLRAETGAVMGTLGAFFLLVSTQIATLNPATASTKLTINPDIFYAAAFIAGFAEKPFRELVRRLTQALFGSSEKAAKSGATVHVAENGLITLELSSGLALQISAEGVPGETSPNGN